MGEWAGEVLKRFFSEVRCVQAIGQEINDRQINNIRRDIFPFDSAVNVSDDIGRPILHLIEYFPQINADEAYCRGQNTQAKRNHRHYGSETQQGVVEEQFA